MALRIVFALTLAFFALLLPAERLGLPRDDIKAATLIILLGAGCILGLSAAETHFKRVFQKPYGALSALSLVLGVWLFLASRMEPLTTKSGSALILSTQLIVPMISFALSTLIFLLLPQPKLKATQECFTIGSLLLSAGLLFSLLSSWFTTFVSITAYGQQTAILVFSIASFAVAFGGSLGVKRLSAFFAGVFLVFVLFPLVIEMSFSLERMKILKWADYLVQQLNQEKFLTWVSPLQEGDRASLRQMLIGPNGQTHLVQDILLGVALAWFFAQNLTLYEKRWVSLKIAFTAFFLNAAIISLIFYASSLFSEMIHSQIIAHPAQHWPDFVFNEPLKGWLTVCGISPINVDDVIRACHDLRGESASFRFDGNLGIIAIAQWRGWPILFGVITNLLIPLFMLCPLILLLHSWGSGFSESVASMVQTPIALKSSLVIWMRIGVVIIYFCLILAWYFNFTLLKLHLAVLCSIALLIFAFGYLLAFFTSVLALMRKIYSRKISPASPTP